MVHTLTPPSSRLRWPQLFPALIHFVDFDPALFTPALFPFLFHIQTKTQYYPLLHTFCCVLIKHKRIGLIKQFIEYSYEESESPLKMDQQYTHYVGQIIENRQAIMSMEDLALICTIIN